MDPVAAKRDVLAASRAIVIRLLPTQRDLLPLDEAAMELMAGEFQPRLLTYCLQSRLSVNKYKISSHAARLNSADS